MRVITADGRPYLELTDESYDVIVVDTTCTISIHVLLDAQFFRHSHEGAPRSGVLAL